MVYFVPLKTGGKEKFNKGKNGKVWSRKNGGIFPEYLLTSET